MMETDDVELLEKPGISTIAVDGWMLCPICSSKHEIRQLLIAQRHFRYTVWHTASGRYETLTPELRRWLRETGGSE